jgi:hypothetical protein
MQGLSEDIAPVAGNLPPIARITGTSPGLVRRFAIGQRRGMAISRAMQRAKELREVM